MESSANSQQSVSGDSPPVLSFGEFMLDRERQCLTRAGERVALKPKVYDLLCLLLEQHGRVLSRTEIMDAIWPRQAIEESNLTQSVYELRRALGDSAWIENLPRRGYRFAGEVSALTPQPDAPALNGPELPGEAPTPPFVERRKALPKRRWPALLLASFLALATGLAYWAWRPADEVSYDFFVPNVYSSTRIAVLPFADYSQDRDQQFLGDGIADTLMRVFAGVDELSVIARGSAFAYRDRDIATVARDLEVGSVLEGSVQRSGDRLRIVAQLVRTSDQRQIWSQIFEREADDIFAMQDDIATQVLEALLGSDVLGLEQSPSARTSAEVYDLFLRGRELWQQRETDAVREAVALLQQAVALDPGFAQARSELATALYFSSDLSRQERLPLIEAQLDAAFALTPDDPQALALRGLLQLNAERVAEGRASIERALTLRPNDVNYLGWLASSYEMAGFMGTASRYTRRAYELDPMNLFARRRLIDLLRAERSPDALPLARQTVRLFPESPLAWMSLVTALEELGEPVASVLAAVDALDHVTETDFFVFHIAAMFNRFGDFALADRWRAKIPDHRPPVFREFFWLLARGDSEGIVRAVRETMDQYGDAPVLLAWYGRALIGAEHYEEAERVLREAMAAGPDLSIPDAVSWGQSEVLMLLAGMMQRAGQLEEADRLEAQFRRILEEIESDWPVWASEQAYLFDFARERYEAAGARLGDFPPRPQMLWMTEHIPWWRPLAEVPAARAHLEDLAREEAAHRDRLYALDVPWLFDPEQWSPGP